MLQGRFAVPDRKRSRFVALLQSLQSAAAVGHGRAFAQWQGCWRCSRQACAWRRWLGCGCAKEKRMPERQLLAQRSGSGLQLTM